MAFPQIVYTPAGSTASVTLAFVHPPRQVPAYSEKAVRHDNISTAGIRESVLERIDNFLNFEMPFVSSGADVAAWAAFMAYALTGGAFQYFPDASLTAFTNYTLEDTDWEAAYKSVGLFSFALKFRQVVS